MNTKRITYPLQDRWSYLWLVIATVLTLFSTGQWTIPLVTWIGSIFAIRFMRTQPVVRGYILIWLTNFIAVSIAQMATFRAIENGVSLVRQADNGLSIVTDPYGRPLATMDHFTTEERIMVAQVPSKGVFTLYSVIGDLFGWLAVAGFVVVAAVGTIRGRRTKPVTVPRAA